MSETLGEFTFPESSVAESLGISRGEFKFLRKQYLKADSHWKKTGAGVMLSSGGVQEILRQIGRESEFTPSFIAGLGKNGAAPQEPVEGPLVQTDRRRVTVAKIPPNPAVVLAEDIDRKLYSVWVGRNENFVVGDKIDVEPYTKQPGFWRIVGPLPRDRRRIGGRAL